MKRLLVTGISGFLGYYVAKYSPQDYQLLGLYNQNKPSFSIIDLAKIDLTNFEELEILLNDFQPDAILHLAAHSQPNWVEQHSESNTLNIETTLFLTKWSLTEKIPFLFTSTDLVFDGTEAPYNEKDIRNPLMLYGKQKVNVEKQILELHSQTIIARMPLMYGLPGNGLGFMNAWKNKLQNKEQLYCFVDEYRTATHGRDAAKGLFMLLEKKAQGIYHLGGEERLSRFEFATKMATYFGLDTNLIIPSYQKDVQMPAKRPADVSLDSSKAMALGFRPRSLDENLKSGD